jgi:hypothetical protein
MCTGSPKLPIRYVFFAKPNKFIWDKTDGIEHSAKTCTINLKLKFDFS